MKSRKAKAWALVASLMMPGLMALSCSGVVARTFRDEAVQGGADAVGTTIFDRVLEALNPAEDEG